MTKPHRVFNRPLFDRLCDERKLSRFKLAVASGTSPATCQNAARGLVIGEASMARIATALETTPEALWPLAGEGERQTHG